MERGGEREGGWGEGGGGERVLSGWDGEGRGSGEEGGGPCARRKRKAGGLGPPRRRPAPRGGGEGEGGRAQDFRRVDATCLPAPPGPGRRSQREAQERPALEGPPFPSPFRPSGKAAPPPQPRATQSRARMQGSGLPSRWAMGGGAGCSGGTGEGHAWERKRSAPRAGDRSLSFCEDNPSRRNALGGGASPTARARRTRGKDPCPAHPPWWGGGRGGGWAGAAEWHSPPPPASRARTDGGGGRRGRGCERVSPI